MVAHVTDPMRAALGEVQVAAKPGLLRNPFLRHLIIYWMPWPKGAPTAPEFIHEESADLSQNLAGLRSVAERFVERAGTGRFEDHPAFGRLSTKDWGCVMHRHLEHHLRQFGL
jgi:hypothetical protein